MQPTPGPEPNPSESEKPMNGLFPSPVEWHMSQSVFISLPPRCMMWLLSNGKIVPRGEKPSVKSP